MFCFLLNQYHNVIFQGSYLSPVPNCVLMEKFYKLRLLTSKVKLCYRFFKSDSYLAMFQKYGNGMVGLVKRRVDFDPHPTHFGCLVENHEFPRTERSPDNEGMYFIN